MCTRRNLLGTLEQFTCPNNVLELKASYCCGTEANRFCCKKSKAREHNFRYGNNDGVGKSVAKGIGITLLIILLVVCGCIGLCCYCFCNLFRKKTTSRGTVLGGIGGGGESELAGQSVHVVNQPGGQGYPSQQPSYPSAGYPGQPAGYPTGQPAGYPTGQPGYPAYPSYQQAPPPNMYPTASYPMAQSSAPPPYPMEQQPPYNPNFPG